MGAIVRKNAELLKCRDTRDMRAGATALLKVCGRCREKKVKEFMEWDPRGKTGDGGAGV
jgi:hypothetical protein